MSNFLVHRPIVAMGIAILMVISTVALFSITVLTALTDVVTHISL